MDIFFFYVYDEESATTVPVQIDEQEIISEEQNNYAESLFESIRHTNEYEQEFWYARELQVA